MVQVLVEKQKNIWILKIDLKVIELQTSQVYNGF